MESLLWLWTKNSGAGLEDEGDVKLQSIVMRTQETGMLAGHFVQRNGEGDGWVIDKLVEDISSWGLADIVLKSDGEPSVVALMNKIKEKRSRKAVTIHPSAYSSHSNGVVERAVREFAALLRCLKLGLESRIKAPMHNDWTYLVTLAEHAS